MRAYLKKMSVFMSLILILGLFQASPAASAKSMDPSGTCGEDVTWKFDTDHDWNDLYIMGSGPMYNTPYDAENFKEYDWQKRNYEVKSLVFEPLVESIGAYAFEGLTSLNGFVELSSNMKSIEEGAFRYSGVEEILIPVSLKKIGKGAFYESSLTRIQYAGTPEQWKKIEIDGEYNDILSEVTIYFADGTEISGKEAAATKKTDTKTKTDTDKKTDTEKKTDTKKISSETKDSKKTSDSTSKSKKVAVEEFLGGSNNYYANAVISDGIIYYSFIMQPYLYAFDGKTTVTYAAGGPPMNLIVVGNTIYYKNNDNNSVYGLNRATGERRTVLSKLSSVTRMFAYHDFLYVWGADAKERPLLYAVNLNDESSKLICAAEEEPENVLASYDGRMMYGDGTVCFLSYHSKHKGNTWLGGVTAKLVDLDTGKTQECFSIDTTSATYLGAKSNGDYGYFSVSRYQQYASYYKVSLKNGNVAEITAEEYSENEDISNGYFDRNQLDGWNYGGSGSTIYRESVDTGKKETLMTMSGYALRYLTLDADTVVVWGGQRKGSNYQWNYTGAYKNATMYVMDPEGNGLKEINTYTAGSNGTSAGNESGASSGSSSSLEPINCMICHGSGWVLCSYCHGTGWATHAQTGLGGGITKEDCPICGGSGRKSCDGCSGSGIVYPK